MNNNSKLVWEPYNALFEKADGVGHQYRLGLWKVGEYRLFIEQKKTGLMFERIHATSDLGKLQAQLHENSITSLIAERDETLAKCVAGLLEILEGESGAGSNFWEQDWRYLQAVKALSLHKKGVA